MRQPTPAEIRRIHEVFATAIVGYAMPIIWSAGDTFGEMDDEIRSGTTFFLDCGKGVFGVTAGHVYEGHKARADATGILCQIGRGRRPLQRPFDLRERLIMHTAYPDIATYRISPEEVARTGAQVVTPTAWPTRPLRLGDQVAFAGFPGANREIIRPGTLAFDHFFGAAFVDSTTDATIACLRPEGGVQIADWPMPGPNHPANGMSGGPMFLVDPRHEILSWQLAGVISEGGGGGYEGEGGPIDVMTFARADLINADGTINEIPRARPRRPRANR